MKFRTTLNVLVAASLFFVPAIGEATILTFDIRADNGTPPGGASVGSGTLESGAYANYGDGVNATTVDVGTQYFNYGVGNGFTPNVNVSYAKGTGGDYFNVSLQSGGWGNQAVAYPVALAGQQGTVNDRWFFTFSPTAANFGVKLNQFTLMDYNGTTNHAANWIVYKDSVNPLNILASGSTGTFASSFASPFVVNTGGVSHLGNVILEMQFTRAARGQLGIDNINFDQFELPPAPEPSTLALTGLAALALCRVQRRRQR